MITIILSAVAAAAAAEPAPQIVVTASREPVPEALSGAAVTVIDTPTIEALALPSLSDLLRLAPGVSVAVSGPLGSQTQVRIRGAESNHTLVLVDGIAVNDPASSGDFRFETLPAAGVARIEVLRGPQSALWGSEAIGGVVSVTTREPGGDDRLFGNIEAGSFGTVRGAAGISLGTAESGLVAQGGYVSANGINAAFRGSERDSAENLTLSLKGRTQLSDTVAIGGVARFASTLSEFDGSNPVTFRRDDTLDETRIRGLALRGWARATLLDERWTQELSVQHLDTANINRRAAAFRNRTDANRTRFAYQSSLTLMTGAASHRLTAALEDERQRFVSDDTAFGGASDQRRSRDRTSLVGEYRLDAGMLSGGVSVRRDWNDRFADATTWRAAGAAALGSGLRAHASYGEGVTDPTFTEQFGFFPGSFSGNPNLTPEQSKGIDAGLAWTNGTVAVDVTWFRTDLTDEIVSTFNSTTFLSGVANATGKSKRSGIEATFDARLAPTLRVQASYAYLDASEQRVAAGLQTKEVRRPRHSGALTAISEIGALDLATSIAWVGARRDTDFDVGRVVTLQSYALVTVSARYAVSAALDLTARVENAGDVSYQDVVGYRTPGIAGFGGLRWRF